MSSFAAPDAAAQLVKLGQAEAFGMLDDHDRRVRNVDADFDDGRGDEDARVARLERGHGRILLLTAHATVHKPDRITELLPQGIEALVRRRHLERLRLFHQRADPIDLLAVGDRSMHARTSSSIRSSGSVIVVTGFRPAGFSVSLETSMSPKAASTSVRGMGVAVMTSMSGALPLAASCSRW